MLLAMLVHPAWALQTGQGAPTVDHGDKRDCLLQASPGGEGAARGECLTRTIAERDNDARARAPDRPPGTPIPAASAGTAGSAPLPWSKSEALASNPYFRVGLLQPDTVQSYYAVTTVAGSKALQLACTADPACRPFSKADVGKLIEVAGVGPDEQDHLSTRIAAITDGTHILVDDPATQAMAGVSQRVSFGSDQYLSLQAAINAGVEAGSDIPAGVYMIAAPLACGLPAATNGFHIGNPLCQASPAAYVMYMGPHTTSVLQYGSPDYSGYIQFGTAYGWTIDANFRADYGTDFPFFNGLSRIGQTVENALLAGTRYGRLATPATAGSPAASAGSQDEFDSYSRDMYGIAIDTISSSRTAPQICTQKADHGFRAGRVVSIIGLPRAAGKRWWQIGTVTSPRCFTLMNADSTAWGAYVPGTADVFETMPSMQISHPVLGYSNARPAVVSTDVHGWGNGTLVDIWNVGAKLGSDATSSIDGRYCAKNATSTTFQLYQADCTTPVDMTAAAVFNGGGIIQRAQDPLAVEKGVYWENATDAEMQHFGGYGFRIGAFANPASSGYDGKIQGHWYNYPQNGELEEGTWLGGDNAIVGAQVDCPALFAFRFAGLGDYTHASHVVASRMDCAGFLINTDAHASFVRLDGNASVYVEGGGMKGQSGNGAKWDVARVLQEVSSPSGVGVYGNVPGYARLNVDAPLTEFLQPNSVLGDFWARSGGNVAIRAMSAGGEADLAVKGAGGGLYMAAGRSARSGLYTQDRTGAYTGNPLQFQGNDVFVSSRIPTSCSGQAAGTIWLDRSNGNALKAC